MCGTAEAFLICLIPIFGRGYKWWQCSKIPFDFITPIKEGNDVVIHLRFNSYIFSKNVLNMANSADPDETSHSGSKLFPNAPFLKLFAQMH